jgi:UDP-hydrolysing UDP-N-acetyl-D-glucosamine 2-epimerase
MSKKRIIAVFTGNRAEYGLQFPILRAIARRDDLEYRLLVSGAHLDKNFGTTLEEIRKDGFEVHDEIKIDLEADTLYATAKAIGSGVISVSASLARIKPDIFVVYADRFEGFAAVIAGTQMGIPVAHIEGGDVTQGGALDDSVRHAMTKLSHLHFTTNENAANRIRHMGEEPWRVHNVGFPAIDLIADGVYATPKELNERFGLVADKPLIVFTQHSVTTRFEEAVDHVRPSLAALETLAGEGVQVVLTYPNNDAGGRRIIDELERFRARNVPNTQVHKSVGRYNYHGMLSLAGRGGQAGGACVGNSSSGVKETPAFGCPTVDVGSRQSGRLGAGNVIATRYDQAEIEAAIRRCLTDQAFIAQCRNCENPYGVGDAGKKIAEVLATVPLDQALITKQMTIE